MILLRRLRRITKLFWCVVFFFILCPLGLFFLMVVPGFIVEDITLGLNLIKQFNILHGLGILLRPIWATILIVGSIFLILCADDLVRGWFGD